MTELFQQCILLKHAVVSGPWGLVSVQNCEISIPLQTMVDNSESTTLLNIGKLVKDSDVNTEEK